MMSYFRMEFDFNRSDDELQLSPFRLQLSTNIKNTFLRMRMWTCSRPCQSACPYF